MEALFRDYGFSGDAVVADIGSGTGKFAGQLLERGCTVYGVEPNDDMRKGSGGTFRIRSVLSGKRNRSRNHFEDHSVDFVTTARHFTGLMCRLLQKNAGES